MRVVDRAELVRKELDGPRAAGDTVGLVPTMGYLHAGHASLIERSAAECAFTVVTVFVNPLQFGDAADFDGYPRDCEHDAAVASEAGAALLFAPPVADMYPHGVPATEVRVGGPAEGLEGARRPGHFAGVATVVAKLFNLVEPWRAYFGEKDFQQLAVVRQMAFDLNFPVDVVGCPTVREADGLACSSRNARLSPAERGAAAVLYRALETGRSAIQGGERDASKVGAAMASVIGEEPLALLDYAEVVDSGSLRPVREIEGPVRLLVAAHLGPVRLIDNVAVAV